jgi:hypothetical protein
MTVIFYFIWFIALIFSASSIDWKVETWSYYSRWRKILFFVHLFFLIFSVSFSLLMVVKSSLGI